LAYYNLPTAIFTLLLFPIYTYLSYLSTKRWGKEEDKKNKLEDMNRGRIQEVISNIKVVKSFTNEDTEVNFVSNKLTKINKIYARQSNTFHIYDFLRNLSLNVILLFINIVVFYAAFQGTLSIGTMVLILQLVLQARRPLFAMSFILTQLQTAESGSKEFLEILEIPSVEDFNNNTDLKKVLNPEIKFKEVTFGYQNSEMILKNVSFEIAAHEKIALVGPSGAGKSTIINLILKLYEPTKGNIWLSERKYTELSHKLIRQNITYVLQENELFSTTIKENVSYGHGNASEDDVVKALKQANAYDFVEKLPKGIYSEVGERGVKLSGGQKQRIQIARAILKDAPILILDEATSSLDSRSESEVQQALKTLMEQRMVIIIAHRFSTIQNVDRILVVDGGQIVDSGSPKDLANREGIYADLLHYQIEGDKKLLKNFEIYK
jgi:ATP-binding cassette, subfamily B, bacterial